MGGSKATQPDTRPGCTFDEFAVFCYLRLNPDIAKTYGIKECGGNTTIGSMLMQALEALGMQVNWHKQLPMSDAALKEMSKGNAKLDQIVYASSWCSREAALTATKGCAAAGRRHHKEGSAACFLVRAAEEAEQRKAKEVLLELWQPVCTAKTTALVEVCISSQLSC